MGARSLKVVPAVADVPSQRKARTVKGAAARTRRDLLVALRDNIAGEIDEGVQARDLAALSRRLLEIAAQIELIDADAGSDDVSDAAETPDESWDVSGR